ncbi:MAG: acetyl-CoA carboxylase carboxyltransferase subunit [Acidimicrobiia bacterium]|nr:acetyl-CoA carboxylase carboxyltransferase subunit [Acidimicrobiia bacterium]
MAELPNGWGPILDDLAERRAAAAAMGPPDRLDRQHDGGRLDARQRIAHLADAGSFHEIGALVGDLPADGFVAGLATVDGRPVGVGAEDFTVLGGSIGVGGTAKRHRLAELALQERHPLLLLLEGAGHRPPRDNEPPAGRRPNDLQALAKLSGRVPVAVGVFGPSAGHGALAAPLADFSVMTATAAIFAAGPPLVKAATGEEVDKAALGGPAVALASGVVHNEVATDREALDQLRRWLGYLPRSAWQAPPLSADPGGDDLRPELLEIVPSNHRTPYDMIRAVVALVDAGSWFEVQPRFGETLITGLARIGGDPVAIVANQPNVRAGSIDSDAADKGATFVSMADGFHLPLLFLTDNPGVLAGTAAERSGILRHAARLFAAQSRATTTKVQVTFRKAYGFGSSAMAMNPFDSQTLNLAFPGVTFGAMPAAGADAATNADAVGQASLRAAELASGYRSAAGFSIDDLIDPRQLRQALRVALRTSAARRRDPVEPVARVGRLP